MPKNKADLYNKKKGEYNKADISDDRGFVNPGVDSAVVSKSNGNNVMSAGEYAQFKMDKETGSIIQHSIQSKETSVIKELEAVDININRHKFNNQLIELTDFRNVNGNMMGSMMMDGTVLVKTYEHTLKKWVLMRRPISTPMFSNRLNIPTTPEQMEVELNILKDIKKYYIEKDKEK